MTDEWISTISNRYIQLYEKLIGETFVPVDLSDEDIYTKTLEQLKTLNA
jgi:phosphoribosylaminoimidazole-succinocarboxamide synthase